MGEDKSGLRERRTWRGRHFSGVLRGGYRGVEGVGNLYKKGFRPGVLTNQSHAFDI